MKKGSFVNWPIRVKLIVSHGSIAFLALLLAACGLIGIARITDKVNIMYHGPLTSTNAIGDLMYATADLQRAVSEILGDRSTDALADFETTMAENVAQMSSAATTLYQGLDAIGASNSMATVEQIGTLIANSGTVRTQITEYIKAGQFSQAEELYEGDYRPILSEIKSLCEDLNGSIDDIAVEYYDYSIGLSRFLNILGLVLIVLTLIAVAGVTEKITTLIRTPVRQLAAASARMFEGDLSAADSVTYESEDELGQLAESMRNTMRALDGYVAEISETLHTMAQGDLTKGSEDFSEFRGQFSNIKDSLVFILKRFNSTLSDIHLAADQVNCGAGQISSGAQTLAQGAASQASSVEELSQTIADISAQVSKTAENASTAMKWVGDTGTKVQVCNDQMQNMMTAMDEITQKSIEISKIVKTIEDIAFQTNILALNAAVEAARAGTAGKGFAVVADEVRNLASKSAEASKITSDLIGGTVEAVNRGTKILTETAETLDFVVEGTHSTSSLVSEIADAASHEAHALSEVSSGIDQISSVIQTNSSTSEESAASSEELSGQAETLKALIDQFKLFGLN